MPVLQRLAAADALAGGSAGGGRSSTSACPRAIATRSPPSRPRCRERGASIPLPRAGAHRLLRPACRRRRPVGRGGRGRGRGRYAHAGTAASCAKARAASRWRCSAARATSCSTRFPDEGSLLRGRVARIRAPARSRIGRWRCISHGAITSRRGMASRARAAAAGAGGRVAPVPRTHPSARRCADRASAAPCRCTSSAVTARNCRRRIRQLRRARSGHPGLEDLARHRAAVLPTHLRLPRQVVHRLRAAPPAHRLAANRSSSRSISSRASSSRSGEVAM